MALAANGFQTGLQVFPSQAVINSSSIRTLQLNSEGGITGQAGVTWSTGAGAKGSVNAAGLYTAPSPVTVTSTDQVLATAPDGSQAQALITLTP